MAVFWNFNINFNMFNTGCNVNPFMSMPMSYFNPTSLWNMMPFNSNFQMPSFKFDFSNIFQASNNFDFSPKFDFNSTSDASSMWSNFKFDFSCASVDSFTRTTSGITSSNINNSAVKNPRI